MAQELNDFLTPAQIGVLKRAAAQVTKSFVTDMHQKSITAFCKKNNISLSIRETGLFSLLRIEQGAKAKPHSILEKTIKSSSLEKNYPEVSEVMSTISSQNSINRRGSIEDIGRMSITESMGDNAKAYTNRRRSMDGSNISSYKKSTAGKSGKDNVHRSSSMTSMDNISGEDLRKSDFMNRRNSRVLSKSNKSSTGPLSSMSSMSSGLSSMSSLSDSGASDSSVSDNGVSENVESNSLNQEISSQIDSHDIKGVSTSDLVGFVGHWSEDKTLLGLAIDKRDLLDESDPILENKNDPLTILQKYLSIDPVQNEEGSIEYIPYLELENLEPYQKEMEDKWQHLLYTGDYDIGEIYKDGKPIPEGSKEKAAILSGLNKQIADDQRKDPNNKLPIRSGTFRVDKTVNKGDKKRRTQVAFLINIEKGSDYAMFQHGDQMGYLTNQMNENIAKAAKSENKEKGKAELVPAVAQEPDEPLAWCIKGDWFCSQNVQEHKIVRQHHNLKVTSGWSAKTQSLIRGEHTPLDKRRIEEKNKGKKKGKNKEEPPRRSSIFKMKGM
ncbi:hypothetical protein [Ascidiimonas sp. W6]|uniref:hypothetical protein n=1 Tax=Ascidiimonas meishanensis TaxID=3128903 RepID=UPI0030EC29C2